VRLCRVVRARTRHACEAFASPAADAPSRARRLSHVDARSSGEGAARPPLCADEAGESWSGRGHRGCTRRCLSRAGVRTPVCKTRQQCTTQYALGPGSERPPCAFRTKVRREAVQNLGNPAIVQPVCVPLGLRAVSAWYFMQMPQAVRKMFGTSLTLATKKLGWVGLPLRESRHSNHHVVVPNVTTHAVIECGDDRDDVVYWYLIQ
jgi:hypothetical protein